MFYIAVVKATIWEK